MLRYCILLLSSSCTLTPVSFRFLLVQTSRSHHRPVILQRVGDAVAVRVVGVEVKNEAPAVLIRLHIRVAVSIQIPQRVTRILRMIASLAAIFICQ